MIEWILHADGEWWSKCNRYSIIPVPEGFIGADHDTRAYSDPFETEDAAKLWVEDLISRDPATVKPDFEIGGES